MLKDVLGFAQHQERATYGLGCKLTITRIKDEAVLNKAAGIAVAKKNIDDIHWYVPHYTTFIQKQGFLSKHYLSKTPTELRYIERSVLMEEVNFRNLWNLKLGSQESMNVPIWIITGFQQRAGQDSQNLRHDTFF